MLFWSPNLAFCLLTLAAIFASSAEAAHKGNKLETGPSPSATARSLPCRDPRVFQCGPIYNAYDYLGTDPDPYIRGMIQRDLGSKYGGGD
jgi:hypothetical protein